MRAKTEIDDASNDAAQTAIGPASVAKGKELSPAAQRALREAEQRRAEIDRMAKSRAKETPERKGPDPARYGDWEKKGIASDF